MGIFSSNAVYHRPLWSFSFVGMDSQGWTIEAQNSGRLGSNLQLEGFSFAGDPKVLPRLEFPEGNFANPGEKLRLRFSVYRGGETGPIQGGSLHLHTRITQKPDYYSDNETESIYLPTIPAALADR